MTPGPQHRRRVTGRYGDSAITVIAFEPTDVEPAGSAVIETDASGIGTYLALTREQLAQHRDACNEVLAATEPTRAEAA